MGLAATLGGGVVDGAVAGGCADGVVVAGGDCDVGAGVVAAAVDAAEHVVAGVEVSVGGYLVFGEGDGGDAAGGTDGVGGACADDEAVGEVGGAVQTVAEGPAVGDFVDGVAPDEDGADGEGAAAGDGAADGEVTSDGAAIDDGQGVGGGATGDAKGFGVEGRGRG